MFLIMDKVKESGFKHLLEAGAASVFMKLITGQQEKMVASTSVDAA